MKSFFLIIIIDLLFRVIKNDMRASSMVFKNIALPSPVKCTLSDL